MKKLLSDPTNQRTASFLLLTLLLILLFSVLNPRFMTVNNMTTILRNMTPVGFAALGLTFVIVVRKFDLSFEGSISFGAMFVAFLIMSGFNPWVAVPLGMLGGLVVGMMNGIAISYLRLPDIVTTIAVGAVVGGASYWFSNGKDIFRNFFSSGILTLNNGKLFGVSYATIFLIFAYVIAFVFLHKTRWGRSFYATGEYPVAAKYSGINVRLYVAVAFVISGVLMVCASTVLISAGGKGEGGAGEGYMLATYAAVLLGAAIFSRPGILPTSAGVLLIAIVSNGLTLAGVDNLSHNAVIAGILIFGVIAFDSKIRGSLSNRIRNGLGLRRPATNSKIQEAS